MTLIEARQRAAMDDEEVLCWAGRAGCKMVFLGLEAEAVDALAEVNNWDAIRAWAEGLRPVLLGG